MKPEQLDRDFARLASSLDYPVYIVTTRVQAEASGCLIGFGTQCSVHPHRFPACLSKKNHTFEVGMQATQVAELFGGETGDAVDKFERVRWKDVEGVPILEDCPRWFIGKLTCQQARQISPATHREPDGRVRPMSYLPPGIEQWTALGLIALSFVTSLITATFSLGGGSLMIIAMTLVMPPVVVVPVHGCVQLGSNVGRAVSLRDHIQWNVILWVTLGAVIGSVVGGKFAYMIPERGFAALIGIFVLVTTWLPPPKFITSSRSVQVVGGAVVSALGMVVGAAGPLVAAFVRGIPDRRQLVATHATLNALQHLFKVIVFVAMGFAFRQYLMLILAMVMAGFAGTTAGSRLLTRVPESIFRFAFRILLSLAAVGLIYRALA